MYISEDRDKDNSPSSDQDAGSLDGGFSREYRKEYYETVRQLEGIINAIDDPDKPLLTLPDGTGKTYSARQLLHEVKQQTELGKKYVESMIQLKRNLDSLEE